MNSKFIHQFYLLCICVLFYCCTGILTLHAQCDLPSAQAELNINNVRAGLLNGGDLWWDLNNAKYEVPKVLPGSSAPSINALFAGALWMGGQDSGNNVRLAAQTFRQEGYDYWPGPITNQTTNPDNCANFNRFWEVLAQDINAFKIALTNNGGTLAPSEIPESILQWPGRNNPHFTTFNLPTNHDLAPFWDADSNGLYDPTNGDYPVFDEDNSCAIADQMIWWIFNDVGGVHTASGGEPLIIEVSAMAYAFATDDALNDATFYHYDLRYRGDGVITDFYTAHFVDPDLGQYDDDFVGCSPEFDLGLCYNGDAFDGEYGESPPVVAVHLMSGLQENVSSFKYYNNDSSPQGNPATPDDYYQYLKGFWRDGTPMTVGGSGYNSSTEPTNYMFPGNPSNPDQWSECSVNNIPFDKRFLMASGPVILTPNSSFDMTFGVYWANNFDYPCPNITTMEDISVLAKNFHYDLAVCGGLISSNFTPEKTGSNALAIYPNPSKNHVYITTPDALHNQNAQINIYNNSGQLVLQKNISNAEKEIYLSVEKLMAGAYFISFKNKQFAASQKLLISQ